MDGRDRRQFPRFEGKFQVDLLNMGDDPKISAWESVVQGTAFDISKHGVRIGSVYNVEVGALLSMVIYYRGCESICLCEVKWKRSVDGEFLYGLYITEWSTLDRALGAQLDAIEGTETMNPKAPRTSPQETKI